MKQEQHIIIREGYCGGRPHIAGHRIKVQHVAVWHDHMGMTSAEIVASYPTITLAQVHAALAYYYDHREEIEADIVADEQYVEKMRAEGKLPTVTELLQRRNDEENDRENPLPPG